MRLDKPEESTIIDAWQAAKDLGYTSSQTKEHDHGSGMVRHFLGSEWSTIPLDTIRSWLQNLSRSGKEPGTKKRTDERRMELAIDKLVEMFPGMDVHSDEYHKIHESEKYKSIRDALKKLLDYHCQGCWRDFCGRNLEGHILDYRNWDAPGRMLILCGECHCVLDALKRRGGKTNKDIEDEMPLFAIAETKR